MIVDSGPPDSSSMVMNYLEKLHIPDNQIDYVVATHPDGDHVGNFDKIFQKYDVGQVNYSPSTKAMPSINSSGVITPASRLCVPSPSTA